MVVVEAAMVEVVEVVVVLLPIIPHICQPTSVSSRRQLSRADVSILSVL
jgi:hypothetical protein